MASTSATKTRQVIVQKELVHRLRISRSTLWRWIRHDEFPRPVSMGRRRVGWYEDEVAKWQKNRPR